MCTVTAKTHKDQMGLCLTRIVSSLTGANTIKSRALECQSFRYWQAGIPGRVRGWEGDVNESCHHRNRHIRKRCSVSPGSTSIFIHLLKVQSRSSWLVSLVKISLPAIAPPSPRGKSTSISSTSSTTGALAGHHAGLMRPWISTPMIQTPRTRPSPSGTTISRQPTTGATGISVWVSAMRLMPIRLMSPIMMT